MINIDLLNLPPGNKLFDHQERFLSKNPDKAMLVHETGTGKTVTAICWMKLRPGISFLVVCPKSIVGKWRKELEQWGAEADVCSRDDIKKMDISPYGGLVIDEAQDFASPLFTKARSKRTTVLYDYVRNHYSAPILLLTATPVRSTPWNIHTLACYIGQFWEPREFRDRYFHMTNKYGRMHYEKVDRWQRKIRPDVESISDIVLMSDCIDVPTQHSHVVNIPWTQKHENELQEQLYMEPAAEWHARHRMEQGESKWKVLNKILDGYRKVIVVCHYRSQIDDYVDQIGDSRLVFVLNGDTKDQHAVIEGAKEADDCIFFIQASMGAGFDAGEFSVVVFASMSFRYVDYVQMKGRVKRINNLHENTFMHLIAGKCDKAVYDTINKNKDFDVHDYLAGATKDNNEARSEDNATGTEVVSEELPF